MSPIQYTDNNKGIGDNKNKVLVTTYSILSYKINIAIISTSLMLYIVVVNKTYICLFQIKKYLIPSNFQIKKNFS